MAKSAGHGQICTEDIGEVESRIAPSELENWEYGTIN